MDIIEKFSNYFKNALVSAYKLTSELNQTLIEPEHILYGLLLQHGSIGSEILAKNKFKKETIERIIKKNKKEKASKIMPALSDSSKKILKQAAIIASRYQHKYIGTEHLLLALIKNENIRNFLISCKININDLERKLSSILKGTSKLADLTNSFESAAEFNNDFEIEESKMPEPMGKTFDKNNILDFFAVNLTSRTMQKQIDPVIAREEEIERLIQILCRRTKNNPVLLGDPGVGKTAIVEGLAKKIMLNDVPDVLINKKIMSLDLGLLIAGTMYRGEFENRLKQIINEIKQNPDIILFIDELHNIIGAGSASGSLDAANILKPALARGQIRCIGATTLEEYKKNIEKDTALERRFQPIIISEPSRQKTIEILNGIKENYEIYHQVKITPQAIEAAVNLSARYLQDKFLPDKAIDLVDEAASKIKIINSNNGLLKKIKKTENYLSIIKDKKEKAILSENYEMALDLKDEEEKVIEKINKLKERQSINKSVVLGEITDKEIAEVISKTTGIPSENIISKEKDKLLNLEKLLAKKIIGQNKAIKTVADAIRRSFAGISDEHRPLASFMFLGPSGVGKTELAKVLAENLFNNKDSFIRIDMSEFSEKFNISKLIGSPAGYIGYREGNKFTDLIKKRPYSVILFDEIEKAHPDIFNLLLQILEDGHLTDAVGKKVNFKNTIIIMTSNTGLRELNKNVVWGFDSSKNKETEFEEIKNKITKELKNQFRPEFLNRIDKTIIFNPLTKKDIESITKLQIKQLKNRLAEKNIKLDISPNVIKCIAEKSYDPNQGARSIRKKISDLIENNLAKKIIEETIKGREIRIAAKNKKIILS